MLTWQSPNGRWQIRPITQRDGTVRYAVTDTQGGWTDWPLRLSSGEIRYDAPERIPAYVKSHIRRLMTDGQS